MVHALKIKPKYFELIKTERKLFEVRKKDRCYAVNDYLALNEYDDLKEIYTGACMLVKVTSILDNEKYCKEGYVILGIKKIQLKDSDFESYGGMVVSKERKITEFDLDKWIEVDERLPVKEYNKWKLSHNCDTEDFEVIVKLPCCTVTTTLFFAVDDDGVGVFYDTDDSDNPTYYKPTGWRSMPTCSEEDGNV